MWHVSGAMFVHVFACVLFLHVVAWGGGFDCVCFVCSCFGLSCYNLGRENKLRPGQASHAQTVQTFKGFGKDLRVLEKTLCLQPCLGCR